MKLDNTIIYLIGIPAVGKYTVAREIGRMTGTPERRARLKDIDLTTISWWLKEFEVLRVPHPNALTLDTSHCEPGQLAQRILEHVDGTRTDN